ncbi:hypothetical protein GCM10028814_21710 [Angustibacter aerolatus]
MAATVVPATPAAATARPAAVTAAAQVDPATRDSKLACAYTENDLTKLQQLGWMLGRQLDCASVFADTAPTWATWEDPWFAHMPIDQPQYAWKKWLDAGGRTLVISQSLVPNGIDPDWRAKGAAGEYDDHVRALARNLVSYDMGGSIIRLAHEANGSWSYDWLGDTAQQRADWKAYWARFAAVMNSVPGASFEFDWTVNAASPAVPFDDYYPGDAAVDVIGIDQYDWASAWVGKAQPARFSYQRSLALGLDALVAFGKAHGKPLSVPEWGLVPASIPEGMGDDPAYADLLAAVVRDNPTRYQSYFEVTGTVNQKLADSAGTRAAWKRHYGVGGDAWKPSPVRPIAPTPTYPAVPADLDTRTPCLDESSSLTTLQTAGYLLGRTLPCAVLHDENAPTWATWSDPWVTHMPRDQTQYQWASWLAASSARTVVLAQNLVPAEAPDDWRTRGAAGEYDGYVRDLGANLVARGFGRAVIRLAPKANGDWAKDSVGSTAADWSAWRSYWARAANVLRATPGSDFDVEWSLNAGYRNLPLDQIYPGDQAVDVVGISMLDSAPTAVGAAQPARWQYQKAVAGGLDTQVAFARTHGKPIAFSEWAALPTSRADGAGDDAYYADQISALVRGVPTRYQAYVNTPNGSVLRLQDASGVRASWKRHYGVTGDALR